MASSYAGAIVGCRAGRTDDVCAHRRDGFEPARLIGPEHRRWIEVGLRGSHGQGGEVALAIETLSFDARRGVSFRIDADSVCTGPG
jgi:hypothetical protein